MFVGVFLPIRIVAEGGDLDLNVPLLLRLELLRIIVDEELKVWILQQDQEKSEHLYAFMSSAFCIVLVKHS